MLLALHLRILYHPSQLDPAASGAKPHLQHSLSKPLTPNPYTAKP